MKKLSDKVWGSSAAGVPGAAVAEKPAPELQPPEAVARESERLLQEQGWCLWRCESLAGDIIVVVRDELVTGYPAGYPVYTVLELGEVVDLDERSMRLVHEAKKLTRN